MKRPFKMKKDTKT